MAKWMRPPGCPTGALPAPSRQWNREPPRVAANAVKTVPVSAGGRSARRRARKDRTMFHCFKIGTMMATIVSDGPLLLHAPEQTFLGPGREALAGSLTAAGQPADRIRVEQNCLLLETAGKKVLFDNGLGSEKLYGPDSGRLLDSLREAGVAPSEIDAVVLTHAHSDHC